MELNPYSEETLQALALKPRSEWTEEECQWIDADPDLEKEIELYRFVYEGLLDQEEPVFSPDFEAGILAQLPVPSTGIVVDREPATWWQPAGIAAGFAAAIAVLIFVFRDRGSELAANYPEGLESAGQSMEQAFSFVQGKEILWGAGLACVAGIFLLDRYLNRKASV